MRVTPTISLRAWRPGSAVGLGPQWGIFMLEVVDWTTAVPTFPASFPPSPSLVVTCILLKGGKEGAYIDNWTSWSAVCWRGGAVIVMGGTTYWRAPYLWGWQVPLEFSDHIELRGCCGEFLIHTKWHLYMQKKQFPSTGPLECCLSPLILPIPLGYSKPSFFFCFILVLDTAGHHFYFLRKFERSEPFLKLCKSHYANQVGQLAPTGNCLGTGPTSNVPAIVVRSPTQQTGICQSGRAQILCRGWFLSKEGFPLSKKCESVRKNL